MGGLRCFNCEDVATQSLTLGDFSQRRRRLGKRTFATLPIYDDGDSEEHVVGDVGPLLVLHRSCITSRLPDTEWFHSMSPSEARCVLSSSTRAVARM
ncbi:unnamed protein product [Linum trigynum]|uniref:Uncharacterized protein n=1 Tax=Linum trigynum TaxID=586398 RepID=A0AAV2GAG4_9ROSI